MAKVAKIVLTADTGQFKKSVSDMKKMLQGISEAGASPKAQSKVKNQMLISLNKEAEQLDGVIGSIERRAKKLEKAKIIDLPALASTHTLLKKTKDRLEEIRKLKQQISSPAPGAAAPGAPAPAAPGATAAAPAAGGAGVASKLLKGSIGGIGRAVAAIGLGMGVGALVSRRTDMADDRVGIRSLTNIGEGDQPSERSRAKYTTEERRQRMMELARSGGVAYSGDQLSSLTDLSESANRAYGVDSGTFSEASGAARRAGSADQQKFMSNAIGGAVAAGLEGSQIGDYLSAMTGYLDEMSQGINVSTESLTGFAGALSSMPFFKDSANRGINAARSLAGAFGGGDRFQQAQAARAILKSVPGAEPSSIDSRRDLGLWFDADDQDKNGDSLSKRMRRAGADEDHIRTMGLNPETIIGNMFSEISDTHRGQSYGDRERAFMTKTGMKDQGGVELFAQMEESKKNGGKFSLSKEQIEKFKNAQMSPEDRMAKVFQGTEGKMLDLKTAISQLKDTMADTVAPLVAELWAKMDELIKSLGGDLVNWISNLVVALGTVAALGTLIGPLTSAMGTLAAGVAAGGLTAMLAGSAGVISALAAGVAVGLLANMALDKYASSDNRYGQQYNPVEKMFAKLTPEWAGGMTSDAYKDTYGDPMSPSPLTGASRRADLTGQTLPFDTRTDAAATVASNTPGVNVVVDGKTDLQKTNDILQQIASNTKAPSVVTNARSHGERQANLPPRKMMVNGR